MEPANSNFGHKLKKRRQERNMSLQSIGDSLGLSRQSIYRYEVGEQLPSTSILLKLSDVLNVLPSYFFEDDNFKIEINRVTFREEEKIKPNDFNLEVVKDTCRNFLQKFIELEKILNVNKIFSNPLKGLKISSSKDIEKAAKQLRKKWHLGNAPISDVTELIEKKGVYIVEVDLDSSFSGLNGFANDEIPIIVINSNVNEVARKRFTTLHELGHLILEFIDDLGDREIEDFCNHFAGAVLLVDDTLEDCLGKNRTSISLLELRNIKSQYGISIKCIIYRAKQTSLISWKTSRSWWDLYEEWYQNNEDFGTFQSTEQPTAFDNLIYRGISEQRITWGKASELKGRNVKIDLLKKQFSNNPQFVIA